MVLKNKRILLTGGAGFVGSYIQKSLGVTSLSKNLYKVSE